MSGLFWKALRREWFVTRWPAWGLLWIRRGLLRVKWAGRESVRWLQQDIGRWFTEGWAGNWLQWRWAGVASFCTFVGLVLYELIRPFQVVVRGLFGEFGERDRKWILPSITGSIGLALLILLFLQTSGRESLARHALLPAIDLEPARTLVVLEPRIEPSFEPPPKPPEPIGNLRDPFDDPPALPPEPEPELHPIVQRVPEPIPDPDPIPEFPIPDPEPTPHPLLDWPVVESPPAEPQPEPDPADIAVTVDRGPSTPGWQSRLEGDEHVHVASTLAAVERPLFVVGPTQDGWSRAEPARSFAKVQQVVHTVREYAEATASSTLVRQQRAPIQPAPQPAPPQPAEPRREQTSIEVPRERRIEFVAFMDESTRIGDSCAIEFRAINSGDVTVDNLVVRIDLPAQFDHRFGHAIDYAVGTLAPHKTRSARLVVDSVAAGSGFVLVRLEGDETDLVERRRFEVSADRQVTPTPVDEADPVQPVRRQPAARPVPTLRYGFDPCCCRYW